MAEHEAKTQPIEVIKVNKDRRLVLGWALLSKGSDGKPYVDSDGSYVTDDAIVDAAIDFMLNSRANDVMHAEMRKGATVFAFPMIDGFYEGLAAPVDGRRGLIIGVQFNAEVFKKWEDGTYRGFSIQGPAQAVFYDEGTCPACAKKPCACGGAS